MPWLVISLGTLIAIGVYPAGASSRDKWIQALVSTTLVACVLSILTVFVSPQYQASNQSRIVESFQAQVDARLGQ